MAKVNIYKKFFEKNLISLLKPNQRKSQTKLAYYLKLYTALLNAENQMETRRGFDNIRIAQAMTSTQTYPGETHYLKYLNSITNSLLRHERRIQRIIKQDPVADPMHAKSQLLMAQNICVLRILKMHKT